MNGNYENARNLTLLFFLDRIVEKGQSRTLHDLSCQFGTKGFTKEMRQIAGGSQAGLRKFLGKYPSLFTIRGDDVDMTDLTNENSSLNLPCGPRDYAQEAAEYFKLKLQQYGVGIEVPLKSLLGHRSQAPPEVRHVSGQHASDFQAFLQRFPNIFIVSDEFVLLKEDEHKQRHTFVEKPASNVDDCLIKELLQFFHTCLSVNGPTITDQLFSNICSYFEYEKWSQIFKSPPDLSNFLKLHSNTFNVHANLVTLVPSKSKYQAQTEPARVIMSASTVNESAAVNNSKHLSLKQRVGNIIQKTVAQNSELCRLPPLDDSRSGTVTDLPPAPSGAHLVANVSECRSVVAEITSSRSPVAVHTEGVSVAGGGPMTLLQLCTWTGHVFVFDLLACGDMMLSGGLAELMQSEHIVKVMHDCRNTSASLYSQYGVQLKNVFDTQVAYAVLQQQQTGRQVYKVKSVSLATLCEFHSIAVHPDRERVKKMGRRDCRFWSRRPLSPEMMNYVVSSVSPLVPAIYEAMNSAIVPEMRELLADLCEEQVEAHIFEDDVRLRKRQRKVEMEVQELRSKLEQNTSGRSMVLSNREIRLLRHLELTDEQREQLDKSYKVSKKLDRLQQRREFSESGISESIEDEYDGVERQHQQRILSPDQCPHSLDSVASCAEFASSSGTSSLTAPDSTERSDSAPPVSTSSLAMMDRALETSCLQRLQRITQLEQDLHTAATASQLVQEAAVQTEPPQPSRKTDAAVQTLSTGEVVITRLYDGFT